MEHSPSQTILLAPIAAEGVQDMGVKMDHPPILSLHRIVGQAAIKMRPVRLSRGQGSAHGHHACLHKC
jgi:hypothetical protein